MLIAIVLVMFLSLLYVLLESFQMTSHLIVVAHCSYKQECELHIIKTVCHLLFKVTYLLLLYYLYYFSFVDYVF